MQKCVRRGGRRGREVIRNQPKGQHAIQVVDPTAYVTQADLAAMEQRYIDLLFEALAQQQPVQQTQIALVQTPATDVQIPAARVQAPIVAQNLPDMLSAEAKHLKDFRKYNPRTFDGSLADPSKAHMWLSSVETIFCYMKCSNDQKVQCVICLLTDRGRGWWKSTERMLGGDMSQITWEQFKENFYAKFFSATVRDAKCQEFLKLEQDNMIVEEYD